MQYANPRYLKDSGASIDSPFRSNNQITPRHATCAARVHNATCHVSHVRHQKLDAATRLQESSNESTETEEGSSSQGGGGASGSGASARGSLGARARSTAGTSGRRAGRVGAVGGSRARGGGVQDEGSGVVGAKDVGLGGVGSSSNGDGVNGSRGDCRDGSRKANRCVGSGLRGDDCRLGGDDSVNSWHASHNTQGVGLLEVGGLGEGVDRRLNQC